MRLRNLALILVVVGVAATAQGQTLWGIDATSNLYTVNPITGVGTLIGPLGIKQIAGAEIDPTTGVLYCVPGGGGGFPQTISGCLYTVNKTTGAATQVGCDPVLVGKDPISGIAFTNDGTLYGFYFQITSGPADGSMHIVKVSKTTGAVTEVADTYTGWSEGHGVAISSSGAAYWSDNDTGFAEIDLASGDVNPIGYTFTGFPGSLDAARSPDMSFNKAGVLYAVVTSGKSPEETNYLSTVNTSTGEYTYVATLPNRMHAIAFDNTSVSIPALTPWGIGVLILLLAGASAFVLRRGLSS